MGSRNQHVCPGCGYTAMVSAGPSRGFKLYTETFVCTACKIVQDLGAGVVAESKGEKQGQVLIEAREPVCQKCKSKDFLVKWDVQKKPCPVCGEGMNKNERVFVLWD